MTEPRKGFPIPIPFVDNLGLRCTHMGGGVSELELEVEQRHHNGWEMAHGGVLMTLLDVAMAVACRSADTEDGRGVVTIEMKTSFMAPGRGTLIARGDCVHRTTSMAFCEAEIVDADGKLVARSSGTFKYVRRSPPQRADTAADTGAEG
ncbi:phenylacetic acid degradation-related protein [Cupriavidus gilardii CR3]|uniref:PaaI family thioesterase n=1 Tax=Cupriavidus gilardii TaxID=82541 RepID=A0A849BD84_9BURK|nr:PaaI family thioesterase [Cupriavidus gilardii]ALD90708.1 phenylacetic acid degradation-related protein [Cupriavidus gilardii CR3]KAB0597883.1 PaaI family thioesterase [Cupriavidus gilardii]MCT9015485.1 PaaI family thioesterase [Cupriavidus gilardii]MCT9055255.1 PaaI family thioesterase [Cupriavidus gilardii]NNH10577.1 PaaI family thioesterase [Cupriavidus gilardii]